RLRRDLGVRRGQREVHDDLHVGVGQNVVTRAVLGHAILLGLSLRALDVDVTRDDDLDVGERREVLEVGVADHSRADEADAHGRGHRASPCSRRNAWLAAMSAKTSPGALSYSMTASSIASLARRASASGTSAVPAWRWSSSLDENSP